ncbi:unnamed protein product [Pleuronectes platessa]|uniref:H15 domain-containing protein n=1 Tax=Pleuronectes platessa TaxID=8262 RepID=A0A9N7Y6W3_PLEPL|nr:unnamed protein product [Pleuronectes platessa]
MSLAALKKALQAGGYHVAGNNTRVLLTIRRLVANKHLVQKKGPSGSFKGAVRFSNTFFVGSKTPVAESLRTKLKNKKSPDFFIPSTSTLVTLILSGRAWRQTQSRLSYQSFGNRKPRKALNRATAGRVVSLLGNPPELREG